MEEALVKKNIMFDADQHRWLEDQAFANKRAGLKDLDSISKLVRAAVEEYRSKQPGK